MRFARLLVFDDEPTICGLISDFAEEAEFDVVSATDLAGFLAHLGGAPADAIMIDLNIPGVDTADVMRHIAESRREAAIMLMTGADERAFVVAERLGHDHGLRICGRLQKPFSLDGFIARMKQLHAEIGK